MADGEVSLHRHGDRQPRARHYEDVDDGRAVTSVVGEEGEGFEDEVLRQESGGKYAEAEGEIGHCQGDQTDVCRSLHGSQRVLGPLARQDEEVEHVAKGTDDADGGKGIVVEDDVKAV